MLSVIILIRKRMILLAGSLFCVFILLPVYILTGTTVQKIPVFAAGEDIPITVIVDPGHGGEDGGAVSANGVLESQLNLAVAAQVNDLLRFSGQRTIMTRADDQSIHTEGETIRARKASDIRNRVALVNGTEQAVLLSIHQNSLPSSPVTHGAQVFWNQQEGADLLAQIVQDSLNHTINPGNEKHPKQIPGTIYLMKHVTAPAILVECGFLSNAEETAKLQDPSYQMKLAAAITTGYLRCLAGEEIP